MGWKWIDPELDCDIYQNLVSPRDPIPAPFSFGTIGAFLKFRDLFHESA